MSGTGDTMERQIRMLLSSWSVYSSREEGFPVVNYGVAIMPKCMMSEDTGICPSQFCKGKECGT